jgi:putative hydrolase of the HAD superfamily
MAVRNIIFDLGGIFLDIHYERTRLAFLELGLTDFDTYYQQSFASPLFAKLEKGEVEPSLFYKTFREETGLQASDDAIAAAWSAMLGDFRAASIAVLPALKQDYNLYLLSNTNKIHHAAFCAKYSAAFGGQAFDDHFIFAHYSHLLGLHKPDVACYQKVLDMHGLSAVETLFVDDTPKNIEGARQAGLQTGWLQHGTLLENEIGKFLANA